MLAIMKHKKPTSIFKHDPFAGIDSFFDGVFGSVAPWNYGTVTYQPSEQNVFKVMADGSVEGSIEVPGIPRENIEITHDGSVLTVVARAAQDEGSSYTARSTTRSWTIDERFDIAGVKASLKDGVLTVKIPAAKRTEPEKQKTVVTID